MPDPCQFAWLLAQYPGLDGFLGTRGSLMLDVVFLAMFAVVPILGWSIYQVRSGRFARHRQIQLTLGLVLLLAVLAFEIDMRWHGWRERAMASRFWREGAWNDWIEYSLLVHLACAIPAAGLWLLVIVQALRKFPTPVGPGDYSGRHRLWGRLAAIEMVLTSLTGWVFYWLAFVA